MIRVHIEMEERIEDVERLLNEFVEKNKDKIEKIFDVTVNQNINGKGWYGGITYLEKQERRTGVTLG